jgi:hypothetical protein
MMNPREMNFLFLLPQLPMLHYSQKQPPRKTVYCSRDEGVRNF